MRYLVHYNTRLGSYSNDLIYDIVLNYIDKNIEVDLLVCKLNSSASHNNMNASQIKSKICHLSTNSFINSLPKKVNVIEINKKFIYGNVPNNLEEVKNLKINNINIGLGPVSSYVTYFRDISLNLSNKKFKILKKLVDTSYSVYKKLLTIDCAKYDKVVVFNGRFAESRVILEYAKSKNLQYETIEFDTLYGLNDIRLLSFKNRLPHSKDAFKERFFKSQSEIDLPGDNYFQKRLKGIYMGGDAAVTKDGSFQSGYKDDIISKDFITKIKASNLPVLTYYMSSQDEVYSLGDEWNNIKIFENQLSSIQWLIDYLKSKQNFILVIKAHPCMKGLNFPYVCRDIEKTEISNLYYLSPESSISSYKLLELTDLCVGFSSSILVEAVYQKKPAILVGDTFFNDLGICEEPNSIEKLIELLNLGLNDHSLFVDNQKFENAKAFGRLMESTDGIKFNLHNWNLFNVTKPFPYFMQKNSLFYRTFFNLLRLFNII